MFLYLGGAVIHFIGSFPHPSGAVTHLTRSLSHPSRSVIHFIRSLSYPSGVVIHFIRSLYHLSRAVIHFNRSLYHPSGAVIHLLVLCPTQAEQSSFLSIKKAALDKGQLQNTIFNINYLNNSGYTAFAINSTASPIRGPGRFEISVSI